MLSVRSDAMRRKLKQSDMKWYYLSFHTTAAYSLDDVLLVGNVVPPHPEYVQSPEVVQVLQGGDLVAVQRQHLQLV